MMKENFYWLFQHRDKDVLQSVGKLKGQVAYLLDPVKQQHYSIFSMVLSLYYVNEYYISDGI